MIKSLNELLGLAETLATSKVGNPLSYIQKVILTEALLETKKTYERIAEESSYSPSYLKNSVAPHLWQILSEALGEKVTKANCRCILERYLEEQKRVNQSSEISLPQSNPLESPEGQVPLNSRFYIERPPVEALCYQEIQNQRALLRIKAPRRMGKTSLMARILNYAQQQNYRTVRLSLHRASSSIFTSTEKFLRWFCANIAHQLGIESRLNEFWDDEVGALVTVTCYFQGYLLEQIDQPLVLALDEINQLFDYPNLARDILSLLRSWYEETRDISSWQKLRILIVYSTDAYIPIDTNKSPLNIGLAVELKAFTSSQVEALAERYNIQLSFSELTQLNQLVGGFPYLVRLALDSTIRYNIPLLQLLQTAVSDPGIYSHHLHELLWYLQKNPDLATAYQQVLAAEHPVKIEQVQGFKLKSMGLVYSEGNQFIVSCELYRQYFKEYFNMV